ncbi:hypothetical protein VNI00_018426 [Paramarasmius palmivorus]|uniref:Uncharacterized protein n=1 Tax=Paramarasmius palmivorus TaxID=297713 RepID=A0AAW0AZB3_9AGAR
MPYQLRNRSVISVQPQRTRNRSRAQNNQNNGTSHRVEPVCQSSEGEQQRPQEAIPDSPLTALSCSPSPTTVTEPQPEIICEPTPVHENVPLTQEGHGVQCESEQNRTSSSTGPDSVPIELPAWLQAFIARNIVTAAAITSHPISNPPPQPPLASDSTFHEPQSSSDIPSYEPLPLSHSYFRSSFPELAQELEALRASISPMTAYRGFRIYIILKTIGDALNFNIHTRKVHSMCTVDSELQVSLADVYEWVGVNEGTFANNKTAIKQAVETVELLESQVMEGIGSVGISFPLAKSYAPAHLRNQPGKKRSKLANRSPEKQTPRLIEGYRRRLMTLETRIPTFNAKVTLQYLEKHAGSMEELARLQPVLEDMQKPGFPIISTSTRIVCPETGKTIMVYLAETPKTWVANKMDYIFADPNETIDSFTELRQHGEDMINDGFPADLVERYYESVHFMAAMNNPGADQTAARHGVDAKEGKSLHRFPLQDGVAWTRNPQKARVMRTNIPEPGLVYSDNNGKEGVELAGVHHLVEGWEQRGHHGKGLFQSKDMIHTSSASTSVAHYYQANDLLERHISTIIEVFFPHDHAVLAPAREAARVMNTSGGCYNARAIVFKLPLLLHCDDGDTTVSVSFASGRFTGGYLYIPQLGLAFEYNPTTVAAFCASRLFHTVGEWSALPMKLSDTTTPGRVGTVFYFPQTSLDILKDKPPQWAINTAFGRFPSMAHVQ